jgi:acyl-CoA reductase-like NAD-dependent aldehyde dehydrogenase
LSIDDAINKGGKVLIGGGLEKSTYIPPTVIVNCNKDMALYHDEVFGSLFPIFFSIK